MSLNSCWIFLGRIFAHYEMLVEFATGLRQCELLGLQWTNFDEKNHTITVTHSLIMADNKEPILSSTKTTKSQRLLSIPPFVVKALKAYRKEQATKILAAPSWAQPNMIFTNAQGDYIKPASFSSRFKKIAKSLSIPTTFHNLRHDMASRMLNSNFDVKVIQEVLGHSTISTTLDIYAHLLHEKKQKVADWLETSSKTLTNL